MKKTRGQKSRATVPLKGAHLFKLQKTVSAVLDKNYDWDPHSK
jgi:hypothetical protein